MLVGILIWRILSIPWVALSHCAMFPIYQASLLLLLEKVVIIHGYWTILHCVSWWMGNTIVAMLDFWYDENSIQWDKVVTWLGENVTELALVSCKPVRQQITDRGDQSQLKVLVDGFYLTRGHCSNSSATINDIVTDKIVWFTHCAKCGAGANWSGTSVGAEGNMFSELKNLRICCFSVGHGSRYIIF